MKTDLRVVACGIMTVLFAWTAPNLRAAGGMQLDGANDYVSFGQATTTLGVSNFTLEVWFKWDGGGIVASSGSGGVSAIPLIAKGRGEADGNNRDCNYFFGINPNTQVLAADFENFANGGNHPVQGITAITIGEWHHAAATYDGTSWRLYLDGQLEATSVVGQTPRYDSIQHASLGTALTSAGVPQGYFQGVLDEARIWNYARTQAQITNSMYQTIAQAPGLAGRWALDETEGSIANDSTANQTHGTLINGPVWVDGYPFVVAGTQWVAYNDHYTGPTTHPNATAWNAFGTLNGAPGNAGYLRNIASGENLLISLNITNANVGTGTAAGAPNPGTPAYQIFNGYVDFATNGSAYHALLLPANGVVAHIITGLNPQRRYHFHGTGIRGNANYTTRYTLFELAGADGFISAHTANALTAAQLPGQVAANQVAINTGDNTRGDMCVWLNINPGPDGAITIYSRKYLGTLPGGTQADAANSSYALAGIRLEEVASAITVAITNPVDGAAFDAPTNLLISASLEGTSTNVEFYADTARIGAVRTAPYSLIWSNALVGTNALSAVAYDTGGNRYTSEVVRVVVRPQPNNSAPPVLLSITPTPNSSLINLSNVTVTFNEPVIGVDANDLLANGVPAQAVYGGPNQYTFAFAGISPGQATVAWSVNHNIRDIGTPTYAFDATSAWNYTILDQIPPVIQSRTPAPGGSATNLISATVTFNETVTGVDAGDLLINNQPAFRITSSGAAYTFWFEMPPALSVVMFAWVENHNIRDASGNLFDHTVANANWYAFNTLPQVSLVPANASYRYFRGLADASSPINAWREINFDDSFWDFGQAPFYYENNPGSANAYTGNTALVDMYGAYRSLYQRHSFTLTNPNLYTSVFARGRTDDGYVIYLNNVAVGRYNVGTGDLPYNASTGGAVSEPPTNNYHAAAEGTLQAGTNVFAIQSFNDSVTSSDFLIDVELMGYLNDPATQPPRISSLMPTPGEVFAFTNLLVTFTRPVTGVTAADLLINGTPATSATEVNGSYRFTFAAPPFGSIQVRWRTSHNIQDLGTPAQPFIPAAVYAYSYVNPEAPTVALKTPAAGATVINALTEIQVTFSKAVSGVNASDLLINGAPATQVTGSGASYTFSFAQPAYGPVEVSWTASHGIADAAVPANTFDGQRAGNYWNYTLVDQAGPVVVSQNPTGGATVTNLNQITVMFNEAVQGVDAGDMLVNGVAATNVSGAGTTYTFQFTPPNGTLLQITWAVGHGIRDLAAVPNAFDAAASGATWSYYSFDQVSPTVAQVTPPSGAAVCALNTVTVWFSEPVAGVRPEALLMNGSPAVAVSGTGAGPYQFAFNPPAVGTVQLAWNPTQNIRDQANPPNPFGGGNWSYAYSPLADFGGVVVINEIMYHPGSENSAEEFIELHNTSATPVNLTGWQFTRGVDFTFTNTVLPANGYLVVAADLGVFRAKYPTVSNVVGNWNGRLSNSGEEIRLRDTCDRVVDAVEYSDEGDWAIRQRGPYDGGYYGWEWFAEHDGTAVNTYTGQTTGNKSLELMNPALPRSVGQNWRASGPAHGTPGQPNSVRAANIAPLISRVGHNPPVPKPNDVVVLTARVEDEQKPGLSVIAYYRDHTITSPGAWNTAVMYDDGTHNDGLANDHLYATQLPAQANGTIIEYYVQATDAQNNVRTWPMPARQRSGTTPEYAQTANALYQVDDALAPASNATTSQPFYRLILTGSEQSEFANLSATAYNSDAMMNATWLTHDAGGYSVHHNTGLRIRGAGSRSRPVKNWRVNIPSDRRWKGLTEINLNSQHIDVQLIGSVLSSAIGLPAAQGHAAQVRLNGVNLARSAPPDASRGDGYGTYFCITPLNGEWAENLLPNNSGGNVYRGSRYPWTANLDYQGTNPQTYINLGYSKASNQSENDWTDLFALTAALNYSTPDDALYASVVKSNANVELFMRYFALCNFINYNESSMCNGVGDDYAMYRGVADPRFMLLPHDYDTILGLGDGDRLTNPSISIWRMVDSPRSSDPAQRANYLQRMMRHPEFTAVYLREQQRLLDGIMQPERFNALVAQWLGGWADPSRISQMTNFVAQRRPNVQAQIPMNNAVNIPLSTSQGYYYSAASSFTLTGQASALNVQSVRINGQAATYTVWQGQWSRSVSLQPGLNNVLVQWLDAQGLELQRTNFIVWYDNGSVNTVSGTLAASTVWTTAQGPYYVSADVTVPIGITLTIQPGTTVYFASGARLIVNGRLLAEGTEQQRIYFTRQPGTTTTWGGLRINGTASSPETRVAYAHLEFNGSAAITATGATVYFDHLTFGTTNQRYMNLDGSSFVVSHCHFPAATTGMESLHGSGGIKANGRAIFYRNYFGAVTGYNDAIDFTGGNRPGPILQILENVFMGSGDDLLDLDGTDAHIEGNIFLHTHKNGSADSASGVSGGNDGANTSEITIVRNIFYDCDQAAMAKQGNFYRMEHNTIVRQTRQGGTDTEAAVICLADDGTAQAAGIYLEGNVVNDAEALVRNLTTAVVTYTNNLLPLSWNGEGGGNLVTGAQLKYIPNLAETYFANWDEAQVMWDWFSPQASSPALGRGANGLDLGAVVPGGPTLSPLPATLSQPNFTVTVSGPGIEMYQYRLDGGSFSAQTPVQQTILLSGLSEGLHVLEVMGQDSAGVWRSNQLASRQFTVTPGRVNIRLNEVLAANRESFPWHGTYPDAIELFNEGPTPVDLGGLRLTDDPANPEKFRFASGTILSNGAYLVVFAENPAALPGIYVGFSLDRNGEGVYLYDSLSRGGQLLDAVEFGPQLTDRSVARLADGQWGLAIPTLGGPNRGEVTGDPSALRLNEWLARAAQGPDFIEVYNPTPLPLPLGNLYLTDNPVGWPDRHQIRPLSFIPAYGYVLFTPDANPTASPLNLNFRLASEGGMIGLFDPALNPIDVVVYEPQQTGQSQGRSPNGSYATVRFDQPTPGSGNPLIVPPDTQGLILVNFTQSWRYDQSGNDLGTAWREVNYDDSGWPQGGGLLAGNSGAVTSYGGVPINTPLIISNTRTTFYFRTTFTLPTNISVINLQLRHIIDDGAVFYLNGQEALPVRFNMPAGEITAGTLAAGTFSDASLQGPYTFPMDALQPGLNTLAAEIHQGSATSSDAVFGLELSAQTSTSTNEVNALVLNEIMADNLTRTNADGSITDWIELYNRSALPLDLSGASVTDDPMEPQRWVFPAGTTIPAFGYLRVICDSSRPATTNAASLLNTGFGLSASGDAVYIYDSVASGGALLQSVVFGLQAANYSLGRVPNASGDWKLTSPTPQAGNLEVTLGAPTALRINEWMPRPAAGDDWFEIFNMGAQPVALGGLFLTDNLTSPTKHLIAPLSFIGAQESGYRLFLADGNTGSGADHVGFKLDGTREAIGIANTNGVLLDSIAYEYPAAGESSGRFPDGAVTVVTFPDSATPGSANYRRLTNVVISEVLANSTLPFEDAIELQNISPVPVNIGGWYLSDSASDLAKFRIPDETVLPPGGYIVFYEYQFNANPDDDSSFAISSWGEGIYLSAADAGGLNGYRTSVDFGETAPGVSVARYLLSTGEKEFVASAARTFGRDNPTNVVEFRQGAGATNAPPLVGPLAITQIMFQPPSLGTNDNTRDEYIEIRNVSGLAQPTFDPANITNTWRLRNAVDFDFPALTLPPGGVLLVVGFDPINDPQTLAEFRGVYNLGPNVLILGPWQGRLGNDSETIELKQPGRPDTNGVPYYLVERIHYADNAPWPLLPAESGLALHRLNYIGYGNEPTNWVALAPTPGFQASQDTDGDGIPDDWEEAYNLNSGNPADALLDNDSDGLNNLQEYLAGTNPLDPGSVLRLDSGAALSPTATWELSFHAMAQKSYTIEFRTAIGSGTWLKYQDVPAAATNRVIRLDVPADGGNQFYRLITPMQ